MDIPEHVLKLLEEKKDSVIKIDLEGGLNPQPDFIVMDSRDLPTVHIKQDLEETPWPLPDNVATLLMAGHVVAHINPAKKGFIRFMDECWRVLKVGGQLLVSTPYGVSAEYLADPTNTNPCTPHTWHYFDPLNPSKLYKRHMPKPWEMKQCTWFPDGTMETLLMKRAEDPKYKEL